MYLKIHLYVVDYKSTNGTAKSFDGRTTVDKPELVFQYKIGQSISTPIIFKDKLIAAGYGGIYLFEFDSDLNFTLLVFILLNSFFSGQIE